MELMEGGGRVFSGLLLVAEENVIKGAGASALMGVLRPVEQRYFQPELTSLLGYLLDVYDLERIFSFTMEGCIECLFFGQLDLPVRSPVQCSRSS